MVNPSRGGAGNGRLAGLAVTDIHCLGPLVIALVGLGNTVIGIGHRLHAMGMPAGRRPGKCLLGARSGREGRNIIIGHITSVDIVLHHGTPGARVPLVFYLHGKGDSIAERRRRRSPGNILHYQVGIISLSMGTRRGTGVGIVTGIYGSRVTIITICVVAATEAYRGICTCPGTAYTTGPPVAGSIICLVPRTACILPTSARDRIGTARIVTIVIPVFPFFLLFLRAGAAAHPLGFPGVIPVIVVITIATGSATARSVRT